MKPSRPKIPPGFQVFADRAGAYRCYHRSTKTPVDCIAFKPYSPEWYAECARIIELHTKKVPKPGTLGKLIAEYRASPSFTDLKPRTQSDYQQCFDFLKPIADTPLIRFDSPLIVRIRDKAAAKHGRRRGNYVKAVLSIVFAWGAERGYLNRNPAASVKNIRRRRDAPEANRPWSDVERHAVWDAMPAHMQPAIALMMYCGLDPQDALALPRSAIKDGHIDTRRGKTAEPVWLPLPSIVVESIAAAPKHDAVTVCATSRGTVWTVSGFRASWRPIRQSLEAAGACGEVDHFAQTRRAQDCAESLALSDIQPTGGGK